MYINSLAPAAMRGCPEQVLTVAHKSAGHGAAAGSRWRHGGRGQEFDEEVLGRIRALVGAQGGLTRTALSRRVCELLDWRGWDGRLKEVHCRVALLKLARHGLIELPPAQPGAFGQGPAPIVAAPLQVPRIEMT